MRSFVSLFARSPFGPLVEHSDRVHDTVELVRPLFEAFMAGEWDRTEEIYVRISKLEHKADVLKNEIRDHLPKSLFMPVDRADLLLFLKEQDKIADAAEDLGVLLTMRRTPSPPAARAAVLELVDAVVRVADAWSENARELPVLQEASFTGPEVDKVIDRVKEISDLEWEADKKQQQASKEIFALEATGDLDPVSTLFWMHIFRVLGGVANAAENTADLLRLMLAKA